MSAASEVRGTDASGIAYVKQNKIMIYKKPKPAHEVNFYFPSDTKIIMGHTRMTTQGNAKYNYNNHPFAGKTEDGYFPLCHNGMLHNDDILKKEKNLPETHIETDSYVAVQLIEKYGNLNFESIAEMSASVRGSFVFTVLSNDNKLYISKGDNPICLLHFKELGLYLYTSTKAIMQEVLQNSFLEKQKAEIITVEEGEIISIDKHGKLERSSFCFMNDLYSDFPNLYTNWYANEEERAAYGSYLFDYCNMFGLSEDELLLLYEMGYEDEDIELLLMDHDMLRQCVNEAKFYVGEYCY